MQSFHSFYCRRQFQTRLDKFNYNRHPNRDYER
jgi:hypothetical protein